jgi:O-acetyl-ADP-ribose deacetylase (regulator of RNase III)
MATKGTMENENMNPCDKKIELITGDITEQHVDVIVNAANNTLLGGGGVDGAIHAAAGSGLLEECRKLGGCRTGEAKITKGYLLPARYIIHTVGPVWKGGGCGEDELLESCYRSCFRLAADNGVKSIAFPSISTGAYRFPVERAAPIAVREIRAGLDSTHVARAVIVCFNQETRRAYDSALRP